MVIIALMFLTSSIAFAPVPSQMKVTKFRRTPNESNMKLKVFLAPQIIFIASCAGAVFAYVYTNLDSIMEVTTSDKWMAASNFGRKFYPFGILLSSLVIFSCLIYANLHD